MHFHLLSGMPKIKGMNSVNIHIREKGLSLESVRPSHIHIEAVVYRHTSTPHINGSNTRVNNKNKKPFRIASV